METVRRLAGSLRVKWHRPVPGRRPVSVCTHRTGTGGFWFQIWIVRFQRRPSGHRTVPDIVRCLTSNRNFQKSSNQLADARPGTGRCPSGHRPMFYESNCHRWEATCFCRSTYFQFSVFFISSLNIYTLFHKYRIYVNVRSTYFINIDISLLKTKNIYILLAQLRMINMQRTSAIEIFAVLSKCGFYLHHCFSQPQSFLF